MSPITGGVPAFSGSCNLHRLCSPDSSQFPSPNEVIWIDQPEDRRMDAEKIKERPEQLQCAELIKSININLRIILEAITLDQGDFIEEGHGDPAARRLVFWFRHGKKEF